MTKMNSGLNTGKDSYRAYNMTTCLQGIHESLNFLPDLFHNRLELITTIVQNVYRGGGHISM